MRGIFGRFIETNNDNPSCCFHGTFFMSVMHFVLTRAPCRRGTVLSPILQIMTLLQRQVMFFAQGHAGRLKPFSLCGLRKGWGPQKKISVQHLKEGSGS